MSSARRLPVLPDAALPAPYDGWALAALGGPLPRETGATCDDCVMVAAGEEDAGALGFDPVAKCCTHTPSLPNFRVGAALAGASDAAARGRESLRARIAARVAVTPLGVAAPSHRRALEDLAHAQGEFGRVGALRCPHLVDEGGGRCGLWAHRNATCATWFCKHERGARGEGFWRALKHLLHGVEAALARHCLLRLDLPPEALARAIEVGPDDGARPEFAPDGAHRRALWGPWAGREEAFFVACAGVVEGVAWEDVLRIGGAEVEARARVARHRYEGLARATLPARLRVGVLQGAVIGAAHTRVATYSKLDPVALPHELLPALGRFDGRPTPAVVAEVERAHGLELDDELLRTLEDFGVLVDADE